MKSNHTPRYAQTKTMILLVDFWWASLVTQKNQKLTEAQYQKPDPPISDQVFYPTSTMSSMVEWGS